MLALLVVLIAQAAPPQGLGLRELQERARKNDPRTMQAVAQLENAHGKHDEAAWAFFPNFQVTTYIAGPTPERRLKAGDYATDPTNPNSLTPGTLGDSWLRGNVGITMHADVQTVFPIWTFGKLTAGKAALEHLVNATEAL